MPILNKDVLQGKLWREVDAFEVGLCLIKEEEFGGNGKGKGEFTVEHGDWVKLKGEMDLECKVHGRGYKLKVLIRES